MMHKMMSPPSTSTRLGNVTFNTIDVIWCNVLQDASIIIIIIIIIIPIFHMLLFKLLKGAVCDSNPIHFFVKFSEYLLTVR